jgi:hypothetical protein
MSHLASRSVPPLAWVAVAIAAFATVSSGGTAVRLHAQASPPGRWRATLDLSGNITYGAASQRVLNGAAGASRRAAGHEWRLDAQSGYGDALDRVTGARRVTIRQSSAGFSVDWAPQAALSPFGFATIEANLQQRIASRRWVGVGAKATAWRGTLEGGFAEEASLSLAAIGESIRRTTATSDPAGASRAEGTRVRWSVRGRVRTRVGPSLRLAHTTFYQPTVSFDGRWTLDALTQLSVPITQGVAATLTHRERIDSEARQRGAASARDGQLLFGVRASW